MAVLLGPRLAEAGNIDAFYLGNDAAMQAGAITADARGGSAIWYNPAGLAKVPGLRLDVSASAYSLRFGGQPALQSGAQTQVTRLTNVDVNVVAASLAITHRAGPVGIGVGIFVPAQHTTYLRTKIVQPATATTAEVNFDLDYYERVQEYFAGPSLGVKLHPAIDFGGSFFVHYRNQLATGASHIALLDGPNGILGATAHQTLDWQQIGAQMVLGIQVHLTRTSKVGATLKFPSLRIYQFQQSVDIESTSLGDRATEKSEFVDRSGGAANIVVPARILGGFSHDFGRVRVAADLSYQGPLRASVVRNELVTVVNGRLGARYRLSDSLAFGWGTFTDRSPAPTPVELGDARLNFYGVTLATDFRTHYTVTQRSRQSQQAAHSMVFGTTLALSYALGLGKTVQGEIGGQGEDLYRRVPTNVTAHEVTLHIGSSLME